MNNKTNIKNEIINELLDVLLSKLEENLRFDENNFKYGKYYFDICHTTVWIKYYTNSYSSSSSKLHEINFDQKLPLIKKSRIWDIFISLDKLNKRKEIENNLNYYNNRHNKIVELLLQRNILIEREKEIKINKEYISLLPEERQKQILRSAKINRIIDDEN
jgi:hypothetical protein